MVMQRIANPSTPVRFRPRPPNENKKALKFRAFLCLLFLLDSPVFALIPLPWRGIETHTVLLLFPSLGGVPVRAGWFKRENITTPSATPPPLLWRGIEIHTFFAFIPLPWRGARQGGVV